MSLAGSRSPAAVQANQLTGSLGSWLPALTGLVTLNLAVNQVCSQCSSCWPCQLAAPAVSRASSIADVVIRAADDGHFAFSGQSHVTARLSNRPERLHRWGRPTDVLVLPVRRQLHTSMHMQLHASMVTRMRRKHTPGLDRAQPARL